MELIYIWIDKFRNFEKNEINLSDKFLIKYDLQKRQINIIKNKTITIFPEFISNVNAIVGKNSVGKTNLLDLIGLRKSDRNRNNNEFEIRYKKKRKWGMNFLGDVESETKNSRYFFIYYFGVDNQTGEDLFVVEGNDIESYTNIFEQHEQVNDAYWKSKYWFAFICSYQNGKFVYKFDMNYKFDYYKDIEKNKPYNYYSCEQDKYAIINFRNTFNELYYGKYIKIEDSDESYIHIPRRNANFNSKLLSYKIKTLYEMINNSNRTMYKDSNYNIKIYFYSNKDSSFMDENEKINLKKICKGLGKKEKHLLKFIESYIKYFYFSFYSNTDCLKENKLTCKKDLESLLIEGNSLEEYIKYYEKAIEIIASSSKIEEINYLIEFYNKMVLVIQMNFDSISILDDNINFSIEKDSDIKKIIELIEVIFDSSNNEPFGPFGNFFHGYKIYNLSDGEEAYLGLYASINEQIKLFTNSKKKFILLFDEPETKMHPELSRNFINDLIKFLNIIKKENQKFQIIIASHSPFILSDIPKSNVVHIERGNDNALKIFTSKVDTFGQNIHTMLKNDFFMKSTIGEFAKTQVNKIIEFLENDEEESNDMNYEKAKYIIDNIGESVIKYKLNKMYDEVYLKHNEKVRLLQEKLAIKKDMDRNELLKLKNKLENTLLEINKTLLKGD